MEEEGQQTAIMGLWKSASLQSTARRKARAALRLTQVVESPTVTVVQQQQQQVHEVLDREGSSEAESVMDKETSQRKQRHDR